MRAFLQAFQDIVDRLAASSVDNLLLLQGRVVHTSLVGIIAINIMLGRDSTGYFWRRRQNYLILFLFRFLRFKLKA